MDFNQLIDKIDHIKLSHLTGIESHKELAPPNRTIYTKQKIPKNAREAGVMILIYIDKNKKSNILLTQRANYKGIHGGQISFPGGKKETLDVNLQETALRETFEEVGILSSDIHVIKQLTSVYIPPSNFVVNPYIGIINKVPCFKINNEVDKLIHLPIEILLNPTTLSNFKSSTATSIPCFNYKAYNIWGATAMILNEFKEVLKTL